MSILELKLQFQITIEIKWTKQVFTIELIVLKSFLNHPPLGWIYCMDFNINNYIY